MSYLRFCILIWFFALPGLLQAQTTVSSGWVSVDGNDQRRTYAHPSGWEIQVPEKAREEDGENIVRWGAWINSCWMEWSVGLFDKETEVHFSLPMVKRYDEEQYQPFPSELNPDLAARQGFRPSIRRWEDNDHQKISIMVDFDAKHLLGIYFQFSNEHAEAGEEEWKKLLATVKAKPQEKYLVSDLVAGFFDPVPHTQEALSPVEGPLKGKVDHFYWEAPESIDWDSLYEYDPLVAALPDGGCVLAWRDSSHQTHFQFFSSDLQARGKSIAGPGMVMHAITGDNKGFAGLFSVFQGDYFQYNGYTWLIAFDLQGKERFRTKVLGTEDISVPDESIVFRRRKNQNLAFSGDHYCVYVSIEHNFGPGSGVHEGDYSRFYDEKGQVIRVGDSPTSAERGENWGVSHSFTKALCWDGEMFCFLTVGDGHPRGIAYKRYGPLRHTEDLFEEVNAWPIPGDLGDNSVYQTEIHGLAANRDVVVGIFTSLLHTRTFPGTDYNYRDVYLFVSNKSGTKFTVKPLQVSPGLDEVNPKIARYRDFFLVVWGERDIFQKYPFDSYTERYLLLNSKGEKMTRPENLDTWFALEAPKSTRNLASHMSDLGGSSLVPLKNGDVVWLRYLPEGNAAEIVRIRK